MQKIFHLALLGWTAVILLFLTGMVPDERWTDRYWLSSLLIWAAGLLLLLFVRVAVHVARLALRH